VTADPKDLFNDFDFFSLIATLAPLVGQATAQRT